MNEFVRLSTFYGILVCENMVISDDFEWDVMECCFQFLVINGAILTFDLRISTTVNERICIRANKEPITASLNA